MQVRNYRQQCLCHFSDASPGELAGCAVARWGWEGDNISPTSLPQNFPANCPKRNISPWFHFIRMCLDGETERYRPTFGRGVRYLSSLRPSFFSTEAAGDIDPWFRRKFCHACWQQDHRLGSHSGRPANLPAKKSPTLAFSRPL